MKKISLIFIFALAIGVGCKKKSTSTSSTKDGDKKEDPCASMDVTYASIEPIFKANCVKCHTPPKAAKGIDLNTYESTSNLANNDKLTCVLKGESCKAMPPMGKLNDEDLNNMLCWIKGGAPK